MPVYAELGAVVKRGDEDGADLTRLMTFETEAEFKKAQLDKELLELNVWRFVSGRIVGMSSVHDPTLIKV